MEAPAVPAPPRIFRIFISYASEDQEIAKGVFSRFKTALPDFFAEVNFDKSSLEVGLREVYRIPELASSLLRELNLMHKDAQEAKMDKPGKWTK